MAVVERPTTWFEDIVESVGRFQPILPECVKSELEKLAASQGKRSRSARICLELASKFEQVPCGGAKVDDEVLSAALSRNASVATTDAKLRESLRAAHVRVVTLHSGRVALE